MHIRDHIAHERGQKFEDWQRITAEVLGRPGVQQQLGQLGAQLAKLNRNAFLPDVRHSEVSMPRRQLATDNVGILPYLASDSNLRPHDTLLQPTPARRERTRALLGQASLDNSDRALDAFIQRSIAQMDAGGRQAFVNPRRAVSGGAVSHYDEDTSILVASRPLVVPNWQELPSSRVLRGAIGTHELVHALDVEELMGEPHIYYRARTELRGYRVGAVVAEDAIASGELSRWLFEYDDNITMEVEEIRQTHGIDAEALLNGGRQITEADDPAVLPLLLLGVVELF